MKPIIQFIRTTLTGGILFLLPVILLIMVVNRALELLVKISEPLAARLPEIVLGFDGSKLLALLLLLVLCFFGGLLFRSTLIKTWIGSLEDNVLSYLPGYAMVKSITADTVGEKLEKNLQTVLVADGEGWKIGFLVEEQDGFCTVFLPEAPRHDSGDVVILPSSVVKRTGVPTNMAARSLKNYGKGAIQWIKK